MSKSGDDETNSSALAWRADFATHPSNVETLENSIIELIEATALVWTVFSRIITEKYPWYLVYYRVVQSFPYDMNYVVFRFNLYLKSHQMYTAPLIIEIYVH